MPLAVAAARHGLPGAGPVEVDVDVDIDVTWPAAVGGLEAQRLVGLTRALVADGHVEVTAAGDETLLEAHHRLADRDMTLERELLAALGEWGIEPQGVRVLKGVAIAHLDEHDASLRSFCDVDLLVAGSDVDRIVRRAVERGSERSFPEPRPGFDRRFGKGVNLVRPSGFALDLHRSLALGPFGVAVQPADLLASSQPFELGGTRLSALGPRQRWLHACYHATLGSAVPPLVSLRDVVLTMPADVDGLSAALDLARRWRGEAVVAEAVRLAARTLRLDVTSDPRWGAVAAWLDAARPTATEQRWLGVYRGERSTPLQTRYGLEAVGGVAPRLAYAHAVLAPRQVGTDPSRVHRWRRAVAAVRRRALGPLGPVGPGGR